MSDSFEVNGADQFLRLSKALKAAGQTELRKELNKGMRVAAKPLIQSARDAYREQMPKRGGLNEFLASKSTRVVTATGRDPGVKIKVAKLDERIDTEGRITHPVFGRGRVVQQVKPRVFSDAMQRGAPAVIHGLEQALESMAARIIQEARS